jgi:2-C-methyl-D-erythritol 4-phosphate cytidylyltransferase
MRTVALIVAGGRSARLGGEVPKQFRTICGRPMLSWTVDCFEKAGTIDQVLVVVPEDYMIYTSEKVIDPYDCSKAKKIVAGGASRRQSVLNGLNALPLATDYVAIHDGARPLVAPGDIDRVVGAAISDRAAILAVRATDTVKRVRDSFVISTLERDSLFMAQTPQVFQYDLIMKTHRDYPQKESDDSVTDDASMVERLGFKVRTVEPTSPNFKVTTADDLVLAEAILKGRGNG